MKRLTLVSLLTATAIMLAGCGQTGNTNNQNLPNKDVNTEANGNASAETDSNPTNDVNPDNGANNGVTNNDATNNGTANNGTANNGTTNNGTTNNGTTNGTGAIEDIGQTITGTLEDIGDTMFGLTDEQNNPYSFNFTDQPEGLSNLQVGDKVTVTYTGTYTEGQPFEGQIISIEKAE